jgi:hypothetical protein
MPKQKFDLTAAVCSVQQSFLNLVQDEYQKLQTRFRDELLSPDFDWERLLALDYEIVRFESRAPWVKESR